MKKIFLVVILFLSNASIQITVLADDLFENKDSEELGEKAGTVALVLSIIGFAYVILRRTQVISKTYLSDEKKELKDKIRSTYKTWRKPLLNLHFWVNIGATVAALIHGYFLFDEELKMVITGSIATLAMLLLSVSGILIWKRFKPIWDYRTSRTALRYVHRQWLFTSVFLFGLTLYLMFE